MDPHEALLVALVALTMAADLVKKHLAWDPLSLQLPLDPWTLQPPCLDVSATAACVMTLAS